MSPLIPCSVAYLDDRLYVTTISLTQIAVEKFRRNYSVATSTLQYERIDRFGCEKLLRSLRLVPKRIHFLMTCTLKRLSVCHQTLLDKGKSLAKLAVRLF